MGLFGQGGFFLTRLTYDVGVMVMFLFQMVFMDTALTIVTGAAAPNAGSMLRSRYPRSLMGAFTYPLYAQLGMGRRLAVATRRQLSDWARATATSPARAWCMRSEASPRLAVSMIIGPRIGKYQADGQAQCRCRATTSYRAHSVASSWPSAGSGSIPVRRWALGQRQPAHRHHRGQHDAGRMTGSFGAMLYMWMRYGKPDASMAGNGLLAGLVAITAPSGFVNTVGACIIGFDRRRAGLLSR